MRDACTILLLVVAALGLGAQALEAQDQRSKRKRTATLRFGTGLIDVPHAFNLAGGEIRISYSQFWLSNDSTQVLDENGAIQSYRSTTDDGKFAGDFAIAYAPTDALEFGFGIQSLATGTGEGRPLATLFGSWTAMRKGCTSQTANRTLVDLAFGLRLANQASVDGRRYSPNRLGIIDERLDVDEFSTRATPYVVASRCFEGLRQTDDFTVSVGWGHGLFHQGSGNSWYKNVDSAGFFGGVAWHGFRQRMLTVMTEFNGFDWNARVVWEPLNGISAGFHVLGINYRPRFSEYRSTKLGFSVSLRGEA